MQELLATHENIISPLLGELWPPTPFKVEDFGPVRKYTLGPMENGDWAMIHHIREPDGGPPHCHPCNMVSHIIKGSYMERIWDVESGTSQDILRQQGSRNEIGADTVHSIISLPEGDCWTLVFAGPVIRQWQHYPELSGNG